MPGTLAFAVDEHGAYLWKNRSIQDELRSLFGSARGHSIREHLLPQQADERLEKLHTIIESQQPTTYFEMLSGIRRRTRVWALDPLEFGKHGCFIVITPEMHRAPDADLHPTLSSGLLGPLAALSERELIVLRHAASGLSSAETAAVELRSAKTVENQVQAIHTKLKLQNRAELVRFACERGILAFSSTEWRTIVAHSQHNARARPLAPISLLGKY